MQIYLQFSECEYLQRSQRYEYMGTIQNKTPFILVIEKFTLYLQNNTHIDHDIYRTVQPDF